MSVSEITDDIGVSQPTISHHLAILRQMGLVKVRQEGRQTCYTLNQERVVACCGRLMQTFAPEETATQELAEHLNPEP
jgi:DNA-binding transcriptional ArsR family regulator